MDVWIYKSTILDSRAIDGGGWWASRPGRFTPGERAPGIHWIGDCVGPRAGLDAVEKIKISFQLGFEPRPSDEPLYRLQVFMAQYIIKHWGLYFYKDKTKRNSVRVNCIYKCTCRFINPNSRVSNILCRIWGSHTGGCLLGSTPCSPLKSRRFGGTAFRLVPYSVYSIVEMEPMFLRNVG
jgi:hypothetical protein